MTARTCCESASASSSRRSTTTPAPSERTKPSASSENALQRPSADSAPALLNETMRLGPSTRLTPPASATSAAPDRSRWQASAIAVSDEEHAVSITMLRPRRSRTYETRFATMLSAAPVPEYGPRLLGDNSLKRAYSMLETPIRTSVREPARLAGTMPAFSRASHASSRVMRCWGSIAAASLGEIPKKPQSKASTSSK